ncbi:hypothetical protein LXN10_03455 [Arcobacter sp. KX21116]|uniref:hypothetical protein n=1 Tax=Arcobacter iocasae TaxID=2906515 RepID=UPI0035D46F51
MDNFLDKVNKNIKIMKSYNIKTVFTISTTTKQELLPYLTPIRKNNDFSVCGCVIFDVNILSLLIKNIDGEVDFILVDSEKKIPLKHVSNNKNYIEESMSINTIDKIDTSNFSKYCFLNIKKSKVFEFKPNDLTVNAAWLFISLRLLLLSEKKISILGSGNIGSKLALKLVESGANVHIYRRDSLKGYSIERGLNFIKSKNTIARIHYHEDILQTSFQSDILIGSTDGVPIITKDIIKSVKKDCIIIDLGKNNLTKEAITFSQKNNIEIWRTDVSAALEGYIYEVLRLNDIFKNSYGKRNLEYCSIVAGGYFGSSGDIVVDNIITPSYVIGVANGDGTFKDNLEDHDKENILKLENEFIFSLGD